MASVAAGWRFSVGLRRDGTVVAAGSYHTVGLTAWGTVVAAGRSDFGQCDVSAWKDVVTIATGGAHTVGLRSEGSVIGVGKRALHGRRASRRGSGRQVWVHCGDCPCHLVECVTALLGGGLLVFNEVLEAYPAVASRCWALEGDTSSLQELDEGWATDPQVVGGLLCCQHLIDSSDSDGPTM